MKDKSSKAWDQLWFDATEGALLAMEDGNEVLMNCFLEVAETIKKQTVVLLNHERNMVFLSRREQISLGKAAQLKELSDSLIRSVTGL